MIVLKQQQEKQPDRNIELSSNGYGKACKFAYLPHRNENIYNNDIPGVVGTAPVKSVGSYGYKKDFQTTDALNFTSPGIGSNDFLAVIIARKGASGATFQYILSGDTTTAGGGIHIFMHHATASNQWGIHNISAKGSGNVLSTNVDYVLTIRRVGTTVYFLQDGVPTSTASVSLNAASDVFIDGTFSLNQYRPDTLYRGDNDYSGVFVLEGKFTEQDAINLTNNAWQIFKERDLYIPLAAVTGGRIMSSLAGYGGLAGHGGLAGKGGGLAG